MTTTPPPSDTTILKISAAGEIVLPPDQATISFSVETRSSEASDALRANAAKLEKIVAALLAMGLAERNIRTSQIDLAPQYSHVNGQLPRFENYQAGSEIEVKMQDLAASGQIIDGAVAAGATTVRHVELDLADRASAERAAQRAAIAALNEKAELFAKAAGFAVGRLLRLSDSGADSESGPVKFYARHAAAPIHPGEIVVHAEAYGTYELVR